MVWQTSHTARRKLPSIQVDSDREKPFLQSGFTAPLEEEAGLTVRRDDGLWASDGLSAAVTALRHPESTLDACQVGWRVHAPQ